jgi:hypothetical protein
MDCVLIALRKIRLRLFEIFCSSIGRVEIVKSHHETKHQRTSTSHVLETI